LDSEELKGLSLRDFLNVIRRRRWIIIAAVSVGLVAVAAYSFSQTSRYAATASLLFTGRVDVASALTGNPAAYSSTMNADRDLKTAAELLDSPQMADRVRAALGSSSIGGTILAEPVKDTNVLNVTAISEDPQRAALAANTYVEEFIDWRQSVTQAQYKQAEDVVSKKLASYSTPAARRSSSYYVLTQQLENLRVLESTASGNFELTQPATVPKRPVYPRHVRDLLLGLGGGLLIGIAAAFVAEQLDTRVRDQDEMADALEIPVIGRIPRVPKLVERAGGLTVMIEPDGLTAEAFRILRGNLDFVNVDRNVRSILVTSCVGGEGKSSTACNLAVTLARGGRNVVVVECDLRRPKLQRYLDLPHGEGLTDVLTRRATIGQALRAFPIETDPTDSTETGFARGAEGAGIPSGSLHVLTAGALPPNPGEIVLSHRLREVMEDLCREADIVLVDSPPFLAIGDAASLAAAVDGVMVVVKVGHVTRAMLRDAQEFLATLPCRKLGIVVTNASAEDRGIYRQRYYAQSRGTEAPADLGVAPSAS